MTTSPAPDVSMFQSERITSKTRARATNLLKIIDQFRIRGTMDASQLQTLLSYSPSGTRKYIRDLTNLLIIKLDKSVVCQYGDAQVFKLCADKELLERFEYDLNLHLTSANTNAFSSSSPLVDSTEKRRLKMQQKYSDRQIHVARDDECTGMRLVRNAGEGQRDPLVAALFGPAKTSAQ